MPSAFAFDASEHHNVAYQVLIFFPMAISRPPWTIMDGGYVVFFFSAGVLDEYEIWSMWSTTVPVGTDSTDLYHWVGHV